MFPYFLILSLPSIFALSVRQRAGGPAVFLVFLIFVVFIGFRDHVGPDWFGYEVIHFSLVGVDFNSIFLRSEPLSYMLFWFSENNGYHMLLSNIGAAAILVAGVLAFARRTLNPWLAVVAATPYLIIAFGMSGIRQAMGVGVFLMVMSQWERSSLVRRSAGIFVAALFHTSTLFAGLFVIYDLKVRTSIKVMAGSILGAIGFFFVQRSEAFMQGMQTYQQRYLTANSGQGESIGSLFHIGLVLIPALAAIIYRHRLRHLVHNETILVLGVIGIFSLLPLNVVSSTVASRLTLLLYFVPMTVYPALSYAFGERNRSGLTFLIVAAHFVILGAWLMFANNSYAHLPYRNTLIEGV